MTIDTRIYDMMALRLDMEKKAQTMSSSANEAQFYTAAGLFAVAEAILVAAKETSP